MPRLSIIEVPNYPKYHWTRDRVDNRDYSYPLSNKLQNNIVDLRSFCTPIEDQGNLGSCTGQAIASAIELLNNRNKAYRDISRLFIYYYERLLMNTINIDSGAFIRDGIKVCYRYGAALESLWPYDIKKFKLRPAQNAIIDAQRRKITRYERVGDHAGCLDAITNGFPVIIGFDVYSSFESLEVIQKGIMTYPNVRRERKLGGHAVLLVGYDKLKQVYIARNSWGANWGDRGYFYMPFQVIQNNTMSGDFWVIKSVNNPR